MSKEDKMFRDLLGLGVLDPYNWPGASQLLMVHMLQVRKTKPKRQTRPRGVSGTEQGDAHEPCSEHLF